MRRFDVDVRQVPTLLLANGSEKSAVLNPRGLWIIGADGRVDMNCDPRHYLIVDVPTNRGAAVAGRQRRAALRPRRPYRELVQAGPFLRVLQAIAAVYEQLDNHLEGLPDPPDADDDGFDRLAQRQRINDQAYFGRTSHGSVGSVVR